MAIKVSVLFSTSIIGEPEIKCLLAASKNSMHWSDRCVIEGVPPYGAILQVFAVMDKQHDNGPYLWLNLWLMKRNTPGNSMCTGELHNAAGQMCLSTQPHACRSTTHIKRYPHLYQLLDGFLQDTLRIAVNHKL